LRIFLSWGMPVARDCWLGISPTRRSRACLGRDTAPAAAIELLRTLRAAHGAARALLRVKA
jgi:hypothetical protein